MATIPLLSQQLDEQSKYRIFSLCLTQFFFFVSITVPFDVFDIEKDDIKTIATVLGPKKAINISLTSLFIYFSIHLFVDSGFKERVAHIVISVIVGLIIMNYKKLNTKPLQYYFMDGLIIIQTLIVFCLH